MEKIWYHCFYNELRMDPSEHPCHLTEVPLNSKANREKMITCMFEAFNVPKFYLSIQEVLSLFSSGKVTGLVLDSGYEVTHAVPIFEGYPLKYAVARLNLGGIDITVYLKKLLQEFGLNLYSSCGLETVNKIKENMCYVSINFEEEMQSYAGSSGGKITPFELPDGNIINLKDQTFRAPEVLFNPISIGKQMNGLHELIECSMNKSDIDLRKELYPAIFLSGGTTMFPGIKERLTKEIMGQAPSGVRVFVQAQPERKLSAWIGGSILSSLSTFENMWIKRDEYEESGANIIHRKCM